MPPAPVSSASVPAPPPRASIPAAPSPDVESLPSESPPQPPTSGSQANSIGVRIRVIESEGARRRRGISSSKASAGPPLKLARGCAKRAESRHSTTGNDATCLAQIGKQPARERLRCSASAIPASGEEGARAASGQLADVATEVRLIEVTSRERQIREANARRVGVDGTAHAHQRCELLG